jgi:hypothetical protein
MRAFKPNERFTTTDRVPARWKIPVGTKGRVVSDDRILTGRDYGDDDDDVRYTVELEGQKIAYLGTHHMKRIGDNG